MTAPGPQPHDPLPQRACVYCHEPGDYFTLTTWGWACSGCTEDLRSMNRGYVEMRYRTLGDLIRRISDGGTPRFPPGRRN